MAQTNLVTRVRWEVARAFDFSTTSTPIPVILAVSGGADSICLADAVIAIATVRSIAPIIAHLNHAIRGTAADADAAFVQQFAHDQHVPFELGHTDVPALAHQMNVSLEVAARMARYDFLAKVAEQHAALHVATAHQADDQAETVLLRLIRGTGLSGLRGMQARSPMTGAPHITLLRPLLRLTRQEIEQYCADRSLRVCHDATNDDTVHTRNRIRHELLPTLAQYNPSIRVMLARLADTVSTDVEIIAYATQQAFAKVSQPIERGLRFDRASWITLPLGLRRATLREAARVLRGNVVDLKYAAIEEACDVLTSANSGEIALTADVRIHVQPNEFVIALV